MGLFTKEWITFWKPFRIAIRFMIGDRDLNYVRSQALHTPSQSRTGSAHCEAIFCSYCAVRADWPKHGFSAHFQNEHAWIMFRKSFAFTCSQNQAFYANHDPKRLFFRVSKHVSKAWFKKVKIRLSNQERVRITFQNGFRNVIQSFVNRPIVFPLGQSGLAWLRNGGSVGVSWPDHGLRHLLHLLLCRLPFNGWVWVKDHLGTWMDPCLRIKK